MGKTITTIILAAGASRRMGRPKLFLPIGGQSMLKCAVRAAIHAGGPIIVVTGAHDEEIQHHLDANQRELNLAYNAKWDTGMGSSIATGIKAADRYPNTPYLITLADQPLVDEAALQKLIQAFSAPGGTNKLVATAYPEGPGVPAIFPARYRAALLNEDGEGGAKHLLRSGTHEVVVVDLGGPPVDIDTPADYESFIDELNTAP